VDGIAHHRPSLAGGVQSAIIQAMLPCKVCPSPIVFCVITMLGWGSWANTQKLAGKEKWPFELFYWDYAIGVFLFSLIFSHTLGSFGSAGMATRENLHSADAANLVPALVSGALFNLSNICWWWASTPPACRWPSRWAWGWPW